MKEILFSDLAQIVKNKENIKNELTPDRWQAMDYEVGDFSGKALVAGEETFPKNLILEPNLKGWHRIYVSMIRPDFANKLYIKLTSEETFTSIYPPTENPPTKWASYEYAQEFFWKCADMTNEEIEIRKPVLYNSNGTLLAWLRFEEMTAEEVVAYKNSLNDPKFKNAHFHFDGNEHTLEELNSETDCLIRLSNVKNSDAEICSMEVTSDYDIKGPENLTMYSKTKRAFSEDEIKYGKNKAVYYKKKIDFLHQNNVEALAAFRMSIANFGVDAVGRIRTNFAENHPEFFCKTRDGRSVQICSYAYPEVWDYTISALKEALKYGFDGVSLILHRGIMINFEAPVIDRFKEKYPDIDPCLLPIKDARLNGIWCEFMTEFMKKLRKELDEYANRHVKINIITDFNPETAKHLGIDIETWAKNGLIDCICQDTMELYEDIDNCMDGEFIDMEKYVEKRKRTETVRRFHGHDLNKLIDGAKAYMDIAEKYNVKFYGGIFSWPSNTQTILENQKKLKAIGVENFSVYNFIHLSVHKPYLHALANICHDEIEEKYCEVKNFRVQKLNGWDISTYNPNWRG